MRAAGTWDSKRDGSRMKGSRERAAGKERAKGEMAAGREGSKEKERQAGTEGSWERDGSMVRGQHCERIFVI